MSNQSTETLEYSRLARRIKTGNNSVFALGRALADPLTAVLCLYFATIIQRTSFGPGEMVLGLVTFSLMYPGMVPFAIGQRTLLRSLISQWALILGLILLFGIVVGLVDKFDFNMLLTWAAITPVMQAGVHLFVPKGLPRLMAIGRENTAVVIGANQLGRTLARQLNEDPYSQTRVTAFFDDREVSRLNGDKLEAPISGRIDRVADFIRANRTDQIYIALPMASQPRILKLLDELRDTTASIYFVPDIFMTDIIQARLDTVVGLPVVAVCETPFYGTTGMVKRVSDIIISLAALLVTMPVLIAIAIAIKVTMPGPVLFRQRRYGLDGREINVWKFRSMKVTENGANVKQATRDDDRITPLGGFLRRKSLDELPQFFNVLTGQMSVVGPRPHAVVHNETYRKLIKGYMIRHKVKPGITGWAQINGARGETETVDKMEKRIRYDLEYLRNWSLRLDLIIIARTAWQSFGSGSKDVY